MFNFNAEIETTLASLGVPVEYMFYEGDEPLYITYMQSDKDATLAGDDSIIGAVVYYDFDIYSKGNYLEAAARIIELLTAAGWTYQPSRDSPDFYERDTKYYHKTLCLAKESEG